MFKKSKSDILVISIFSVLVVGMVGYAKDGELIPEASAGHSPTWDFVYDGSTDPQTFGFAPFFFGSTNCPAGSASDGDIFTLVTTLADTCSYFLHTGTTPVFNPSSGTGWTVEFKLKADSYLGTPVGGARAILVEIDDGTERAELELELGPSATRVTGGNSVPSNDPSIFHVYRFTGSGSLFDFYIDGNLVVSDTKSISTGPALIFGDVASTTGGTSSWDYISYSSQGAFSPAALASPPDADKTCNGFVGLWTDPAAWSPSGQPISSEPVSMINGCDLTIGSTESIVAENTVDIDASSTLTVDGDFTVNSGGTVNNSGNFVVINGGTTNVNGGTFNNLSSNSVNIFGFFNAIDAILDNSGNWVNEATGNMELQGTTTFTTQQGASFTAVVGSIFYMIDTSSYTNLGLTEIFSHMNALVGTSINNGVAGPDDADFIVRDTGVLKVGGTLTSDARIATTPLATLVILTTGIFNNNDIFANQGFTNLLFTGTYNEAGILQFEPVFSTQKTSSFPPWVQISHNEGGGPTFASANDDFGLATAVIGDIDNDGVEDLAVSAIGDATGGAPGSRKGAVYILFMQTDSTAKGFTKLANGLNGMPAIPDISDCGRSVAGLGDVDGDTIPDIAIGCDSWGLGGAVLFVMLNADGTAKAVTVVEHQTNGGPTLAAVDMFGTAVVSAGDIDSDGKTNIVIGARGDDTGGGNAGAIYTAELAATGVISEVIKIANGLGGMPAGTLAVSDLFGRGIGVVSGSVPNLFVSADGSDTFFTNAGTIYELDMELNAGVWELASVQEYIPPQGMWPGLEEFDEIDFPSLGDVGGDNFLFDFDSDGTPDFTASAAGSDTPVDDCILCDPCLDCGGAYIIITGGDARPIEVKHIPAPFDAELSFVYPLGWYFSMAIGSDFNDDGLGEIIGGSTEYDNDLGPGGTGAIRIFHYEHIIDTAASDSDGDGVTNDMDQCPGFDDALDADSDGIPDGCDPNTEITTNTVATDTTFGGDLTVDGATFTIPSGITVEFDFANNKIIIKNPGGKILIQGKIT